MLEIAGLGVFGMGMACVGTGCAATSRDDAGIDDEQRAAVENDAPDGYDTVWLYSPSGFTETGATVDSKLVVTMRSEGIAKPLLAGQSDARVEAYYTNDIYADVNELFYQRGWGDGLPIVPPIEQNVTQMCKGTDLARRETLGTLAPLAGTATVENVATNAVMAGCDPVHLPFLIAAVKAVSDPVFDLVSTSTTTSPNVTLLLVNGPAAAQAGINAGANALGRGWRANATLGRALHLVEQNVGGSWPVVSDFSTLGIPGDFCLCLAENEVQSPWPSYTEEQGFEASDNVVTVASAESIMLIVDIGVTPEGFLKRVANVIAGREHIHVCYLLVITPSTAQQLANEGWGKDRIRSYVKDHTRVPPVRLEEGLTSWNQKAGNDDYSAETSELDENGLVTMPFVKELYVIVAGGVGEKNALIPLWSEPVSREVPLPKAWQDLLLAKRGKAEAAGAVFADNTNAEGEPLP